MIIISEYCGHEECRRCGGGGVLLVVVAPAEQSGVSGVAGGAERPLARGAPQAPLVPRRVGDAHHEAVRDHPRAARAHGPLRGPACRRGGEAVRGRTVP